MPSIIVHVGPAAAIFVGAVGGSSYTQINTVSTDDQIITSNIPESFEECQQNSVQSGRGIVKADLRFLSDDPNIVALSNGNAIGADQNLAPGFVTMSVLLIHPDFNAPSSILIPECYVVKRLGINLSKKTATSIPLTFYWEQRNLTTLPYQRNTAAYFGF